ncbi:MAG: oligosaccharide flippase family protein [Cohaesibacter sp.]|jgi:O-antigen/teichoic acid export membrane protein|nr:oligosaccharide flippase family protein [Cohaesibacter sp.]
MSVETDHICPSLPGKSLFSRLRNDALANFAIKVLSAGILYVTQIILARWLGVADFGIYGFTIVLIAILAQTSCLGFNETAKKYLPFYQTKEEEDKAKGFLSYIFSRTFIASLALACMGLAAAQILPFLGLDSYYKAAMVAVLAIPIFALTHLVENVAISQSQFWQGLAPTFLVRPLLALILFAGMVHAFDLGAAHHAIVAMLIAAGIVAIPQYQSVIKPLWAGWSDRKADQSNKGVWRKESFPLFLAQGIFTLSSNIDIIILAFFVPEPKVAIYFAAAKTVSLLAFVHNSIAGVMMRSLSVCVAENNIPQFRAVARLGQWASMGVTIIGAGILLLLGNWILGLFGPDYVVAYSVLALLLAGIVIQSASGGAQEILITLGYSNLLAKIVAFTFVLNILLSILLVQSYGIEGVAAATAFSTALRACLTFLAARTNFAKQHPLH